MNMNQEFHIGYELGLTYDDVQIVPRLSTIESRSDVSLATRIETGLPLKLPLIASPMDTVCGEEMALKMAELGGIGCIHRFMSIDEQAKTVWRVTQKSPNHLAMAAIGVDGDWWERYLQLVGAGAFFILIDVAHGHHSRVLTAIDKMRSFSNVGIIAGSVATRDAAFAMKKAGANIIRVGIGGGSLCTTRMKTGVGVPNITALEECSDAEIPMIADGGIRTPGDVAKALAVGADFVMLGSMLAGTDEAPGEIIQAENGSLWKKYRGSASLNMKSDHGLKKRNVEGVSTLVPYKGGVRYTINAIEDGLRSAFSYVGARNIREFDDRAFIMRVTQNGVVEASPHLLEKV